MFINTLRRRLRRLKRAYLLHRRTYADRKSVLYDLFDQSRARFRDGIVVMVRCAQDEFSGGRRVRVQFIRLHYYVHRIAYELVDVLKHGVSFFCNCTFFTKHISIYARRFPIAKRTTGSHVTGDVMGSVWNFFDVFSAHNFWSKSFSRLYVRAAGPPDLVNIRILSDETVNKYKGGYKRGTKDCSPLSLPLQITKQNYFAFRTVKLNKCLFF